MPSKKKIKQNATKKPTKKLFFGSKKKTLLAVLLIVALLGLGIGWKIHDNNAKDEKQLASEKALLDKVKGDMVEIYDEVLISLSEPTAQGDDAFCTFPNLKFEEGLPSCGSTYTATFAVTSDEEGVQKMKEIYNSVSNNEKINIKYQSVKDPLNSLVASSSSEYIGIDITEIKGVPCSFSIANKENRLFDKREDIKSGQYVNLNFSCSKVLDRPVYRVVK